MSKGFFVTGTDTGVGKTEITLALMSLLQEKGYRVNAMKPIAAGGTEIDGRLVNEDARRLQQQASAEVDYARVNPYVFKPAIAPSIAAQTAGVEIEINRIREEFGRVCSNADYTLVEGIGGWQVPVNRHQTMVDIVKLLNIPVILVVGFRLGCLNHALLTYQSIKAARMQCVAWVANTIDPKLECIQENYLTLIDRLDCPCIGAVPYLNSPSTAEIAKLLHLQQLV